MDSYKTRKNHQHQLKKIAKEIEEATKKKEIEGLKLELEDLEKEVLSSNLTKKEKQEWKVRIRRIKTKDELYRTRKEIQDFNKELNKQKKAIEDKSEKINKKDKDYESTQKYQEGLEVEVQNLISKVLSKKQEIENIKKDVAKDVEIIETIEIVKKKKAILLDVLILIYISNSNLSPALKLPLSISVLDAIDKKLSTQEEKHVHIEYRYEDMAPKIEELMDSIEDIEKEMETALDDVKEIEKEFVKNFDEFTHLKEFAQIMEMFQTIEETLSKELGIVQDLEKDLDKTKDENTDKVLRLESLKN